MLSRAPYCVLCVDDDKDACEMLTALLRHSNIDAHCVQSAEAALSAIKADKFDLYLLDAWLPGLDGFELCRRIRGFDAMTPILFYSGAAYETDKQKGMKAGANAYLIKPNVDGLIKNILHFVSANDKRSRRELAQKAEDMSSNEMKSDTRERRPKTFSASQSASFLDR